jgi:hypothetical protein
MSAAMESGADISSNGLYRYRLWRSWGDGQRCVWIMLNPSTADASLDDHTIRKCIGFAQRWGYYGIEVVNLFAMRSKNPAALYTAADPIGPDNDEAILSAVRSWSHVVCAWGNDGGLHNRSLRVSILLRHHKAKTLGLTKQRQPKHPLYLPYETPLLEWPLP